MKLAWGSEFKTKPLEAREWWHTLPDRGWRVSVNSRLAWVTQSIQKQIQVVVAHTFNVSDWESHTFDPNTWEVETGAIWLGRERNIKGKRQELTGVWSLRLVESIAGSHPFVCLSLGRGKISLVAWLLCFSDLQLESQKLSLGFYYLCCRESLTLIFSCCFNFLFVFRTITIKGESGLILS